MGKVFKKAAVAILAVSMFLQQCNIVSFAEGDPTEMSAEAQAAAEAEAAAQAEAEAAAAQAAAEAEAQAQAEAEAAAAAQAAAEAEAAAQAEAEAAAAAQAAAEAEAAAQAQAEAEAAAAAQAQAEAEAAAQAEAEAAAAAQAEAEAQAAAEAEAAAAAEAEALAAAEAETEMQARSARVNTGTEIRKEDLTTMLADVLPYLFVADTTVFPETEAKWEEAAEIPEEAEELPEEAAEPQDEEAEFQEGETIPVPETWVLEGDAATAELAGQAWNSLELADAQSTDEVTVLNLYADEAGTLDMTQLSVIYEDQILDITNEHDYVINVIADSPEQDLDFSGFDLSENGIYYYYTESAQPGSVLYNFAAMDGEENYTDYRGTLRLWGNMQGTVLAPMASVEVEENLAGAVYAQNISVISPEAQLQRNILIEGEPEPVETEAPETEAPAPETEAPAPETEAPAPETEAPAPETEAPAPETEAPVPETEASVTEIAGLSVTEAPETEAPAPETEAPAPETEAPALETEAVTETGTESETKKEAEEPAAISTLSAVYLSDPSYEGNQTLEITAQAVYNGEVLTAVGDKEYTLGLFAEKEDGGYVLVAKADNTLIIDDGNTESSDEVVFENIAYGDYYIYEVNKDNGPVTDGKFTVEVISLTEDIINNDDNNTTTKRVDVDLVYKNYPEGEFRYDVTLPVTLKIEGRDGEDLKVTDTFEVAVYDKDKNKLETQKFSFDEEYELTKEFSLKDLTTSPIEFYVRETEEEDFAYTPTYETTKKEEDKANKYGVVEVECGEDVSETITNKLNNTIVSIEIVNTSGKELEDSTFAILKKSTDEFITNKNGKIKTWSGSVEFKNDLEDDETYYVYEINAQSGYTPAPLYEFKAKRGQTTEVVIENEKTETTSSSIAITKSVYVDDYAVYATSSHSYNFALFENAKCTKKVSNVETVNVSGYSGTVTFENMVPGETYYIAETNEYGVALSDSDHKAAYSPSNEVTVTSNTNHQVTVQNKYSYLPDGYVYTGQLTLTKKVVDASSAAKDVSGTFYIGLYKNSNYSGTPTVISISLNGQSSASVTNTFRLPEGSQTYYIAEVSDAKGSARITDSSEFDYTPTVSQTSVTITKDSINSNVPNVTVTNTEKVNADDEEGSGENVSVELYLTKRVYEGSSPHEVSDTFYVGLFKDEAMTTLYTDPIPMSMAGREGGELTQKITMKVSESNATTIYVAEVYANGTPVKSSEYQSFGYEIGSEQPIKVEFNPSEGKDEMRAVILNGVYGTMSAEDWENIYNDIEDLYGDDDEIGLADDLEEDEAELESELAAEGGSSTVKTADDTPVAGTIALMAAALLVLGFSFRRRRRA